MINTQSCSQTELICWEKSMRIKLFLYGSKLGCTKFYDLYSTPFTNYVLAE